GAGPSGARVPAAGRPAVGGFAPAVGRVPGVGGWVPAGGRSPPIGPLAPFVTCPPSSHGLGNVSAMAVARSAGMAVRPPGGSATPGPPLLAGVDARCPGAPTGLGGVFLAWPRYRPSLFTLVTAWRASCRCRRRIATRATPASVGRHFWLTWSSWLPVSPVATPGRRVGQPRAPARPAPEGARAPAPPCHRPAAGLGEREPAGAVRHGEAPAAAAAPAAVSAGRRRPIRS